MKTSKAGKNLNFITAATRIFESAFWSALELLVRHQASGDQGSVNILTTD
jgi:hypothetical protein